MRQDREEQMNMTAFQKFFGSLALDVDINLDNFIEPKNTQLR